MNIEIILSSKPHNVHYLKKYIRFIKQCQEKNNHYSGYIEHHHICPKAKDMFPEYSVFKEHPWNRVSLTARQHFVAHIMLWKAYKNRSTTMAAYYMTHVKNQKINSRLYETLKVERSAVLSDFWSEVNKGKVNVKDEFGNITKISADEFDKTIHNGQHANTVMVTDGTTSFRVSKDDPRYVSGELKGHTTGMTYAVDAAGAGYYVSTDDPRFDTGELKGNNAGTITITNGKTNKRIGLGDSIPVGWKKGMTKKSPKGSVWINDGTTSKMFKGDQIPKGWNKGRLFKKKPKHVGTIGKQWITNGVESKMIQGTEIPPGWKKGRSFSN